MDENMAETGAMIQLEDRTLLIFPHKLCRSCLCEVNQDYVWLNDFYLERKLVDVLKDLISIDIELNDGLPSKLCSTCYDHIIKFDLFKNKVLETERLLADKVVVIEKTEIDYDEHDLHYSQEVDQNCDIKPVIKIDLENSDLLAEEHSYAIELCPKARRKRRISKKIVQRKPSDVTSANRQKRGRRKESCTVCEKVIFAYKMGAHMRTHTKEKPFSCEKCGVCFGVKSNLNRHMKTHEDYRPYRCDICDKGFLRRSNKTMHEMTAHITERNVVCPICSKAFKHQFFLKKHMENTHDKLKLKEDGLANQCHICGRFYSSKSGLAVHKMRHERPRSFLCNICGQTYSTKAVLDDHQRVHTGEKKFVCKVCNKSFGYKSSLHTHGLVHSGKKPLSCHLCNKQFRQHAHLSSHMRGQHSTCRPFKCSFCSKTFKYNFNLTVHTRIHTGEKPYCCEVCQKGFYDSSSLKKHKKSHTEKDAPARDNVENDVNRLENDNTVQ